MSLKFTAAMIAAKLARSALRLLGRDGSCTPGRIALKICPDFMAGLKLPEKVLCVTGTNGKTTTSNLAAGMLNILVTLQIHGSRRSVHSIVEYSGKLVNEDTTPEPEIVPIFLNEGGRYGNLGPMLRGSCFAQKFEDAGMPDYTYTTQPLPGQSAEKGTADE